MNQEQKLSTMEKKQKKNMEEHGMKIEEMGGEGKRKYKNKKAAIPFFSCLWKKMMFFFLFFFFDI